MLIIVQVKIITTAVMISLPRKSAFWLASVLHDLSWSIIIIGCNISNTRKSVSSDIKTPRSGWENEAQPSFF